jgi:hypothetical protein
MGKDYRKALECETRNPLAAGEGLPLGCRHQLMNPDVPAAVPPATT